MTLKTVLVSIEDTALDALKAAGTVLDGFVISDGQKLVAEVKQTNLGTTALNVVSALDSKTMSGSDKMEIVVAALVPAITTLVSSGGLSGLVVTVEDFALEFAQSVFNDFKASVLPKLDAVAETAAAA